MSIITVPHPTLRQVAAPITDVDKKLKQLVAELGQTLKNQREPRGVGLAAPQIDVSRRLFATLLPLNETDDDDAIRHLKIFINPEIVEHSSDLTLGSDPENPILEGCLSIPGLYGPVPRWQHITMAYLELIDDSLVEKEVALSDYHARVAQHELDHLDGKLFTDYSLEYELPVYREHPQTKKLVEVETDLLELF